MRVVRNKRGQFIIIAVLFIAIMMVSLMVIMYSTVTYYRHERWEEYVGVVDNIKAGSQQLLRIGLANFTKNFYENTVREKGTLSNTFNQWITDLREAFPGYGLDVAFVKSSRLVTIGGYSRGVSDFIKCYWYYPDAMSSIYAEIDLNISEFGLYGYKTEALFYLYAKVNTSYVAANPDQITDIDLTVMSEEQLPVVDLTAANFDVIRFNSTLDDWTTLNIASIDQTSAGTYTLTFANPVEKPYYKWLIITVRDTRGIVVVSSTYSYIEFIVEKHTPTSGRPTETDDEIYTLEAGVRGQWYWNGEQLELVTEGGATVTPPIPPIPIKQFRTNVTQTGVDSPSVERPCQYEIWNKVNWHGRLIDVPRDLADPYYRFNSTNRMVFQVGFPELDVTRQKVRIWWMDDIDAQPYQGFTDLEYTGAPLYEAQTNVYRVEFMGVGHTASPDYRWDYYGAAALLLKDRETGESYGPWNLHGFDLAPSAPGTAYWRPHGQWEIKYWYGGAGVGPVAPVRLIAIVNSTQVNTPWQSGGLQPRSNYYDTYAVAFITANVKYLQQRVWIYWKQDQTGNGIWLSWEWGKGETDWYAYLNNQTGNVSGPYTYDYGSWTIHIEYDDPGYWAAHWNDEGLGRGLIFNVEGLNSLYSFDEDRTSLSVTTQAPRGFPQGSIEFEAIRCEYPNPEDYTVTAGTSYSYIPTTWMYGGGSQTDGYKEVADYYYVFLETYAPKLILTDGG